MYKGTALKFFFFMIISSQCLAQTESFDIATYTPPKNWKKDAKQGVVNYIDLNDTAGTFCVVSLFASSLSMGDLQKDFNKAWKELVVTPYKADPNPQTETQTADDGWKVMVGAAPIKQDGTDVYIILTVFTGFGKTFTVRSSLNDQAYTTQIDAFFETMELADKTSSPVNTTANENTTSSASTGKFGEMLYTAPAGWSVQQFSDGVVFKPLDLPAGEHLAIQIMQPLNFSGTLEEAMKQSFDEAAAMYKTTKMYQADGNYSKKKPQTSFNGWEYIRGKGGVQLEDRSAELGLELFVIKINNRFERVAILESRKYCGGGSRYYASDRITYRTAIENLLYTLQFTDFNQQPLRSGSTKGEGVVGIWQGVMQSTSAGVLRLEGQSAIFLTNGQVFLGTTFPIEGLYTLNTRIPAELNLRDWATYTYSNGKGVLKMPYGEIPFRVQGEYLIFNKNQTDWKFYKLKEVDGATFSGTYNMKAVNGKVPTITFTADGRFTDNGALKELYHVYTTCVNPASTPGSGTYEVLNNTILFNYTDGRKIRLAFIGTGYEKSNSSPPTLQMSYADDTLTRQ